MKGKNPLIPFRKEIKNDTFEKPNSLDDVVTRSTQALSRMTMSRRSLLGKAAKVALAITGASLIPALPIDYQVPVAEAAASDCNAWYMCGIDALRVCSCACGSNSCPSGTSSGSNPWSGCCFDGSSFWRVNYIDCCCNSSCSSSCCNAGGCDCHRDPTEPNWCGGIPNAKLCCTRWAIQGHC